MTNTKRRTHWFRRIVQGGIALSLLLIGMVTFSTVASAHDDQIVGVASCASPLGSGYSVSWTVSNDYDMAEVGTVTSVTGGVAGVHPGTFSIGAQDNAWAAHQLSRGASAPFLRATVVQKLPATATGVLTLGTTSTWVDGTVVADAGTAELAGLHCGAPHAAPPAPPGVQSIAGHIYLCAAGRPTTSEVPGGTLATTGPQTLGATPNPLVSTVVAPGGYTLTATAPPGYVLVSCGGTSVPAPGATTATVGVSVPPGGTGVGTFYVTNGAPALTVLKSASVSAYEAAGQSFTYDYLVTNTGDVTLSGVGVIDAHAGLAGLSCPSATLAPAAFETCSATYVVTAADVGAGSILNTATAQGTPPATTTPLGSAPSSVTVPLAAIAIDKAVCGSEVAAACAATGSGPWVSSVHIPQGDTAYWKVTVTNTGRTPLSNVTVADPLVPGCDTTGVSLAVGASLSTYCALAHITSSVLNVATASFAGALPPFPTSSAQVSASSAPRTSASVAPVVRVTTSGAIDSLVPAAEAPAVTG